MNGVERNDHFYVTLTSDVGGEESQNTLVDFITHFPKPLHFNAEEWEVGLTSFFCHNEIDTEQYEDVDYIKVYCSIIQSRELQDQTLAVFARPKSQRGLANPKLYFEPKNPTYVPINSSYINQIRVYVYGGTREKPVCAAKLNSGQPTLLTLHFRRKMTSSHEHIIRAESLARGDETLANNTCAEFTSRTGEALNFDPSNGTWEVAVQSISYLPEIKLPVSEPITGGIYNNVDEVFLEVDTFSYQPPPDNDATVHHFILHLNEAFKQLHEKKEGNPRIMVDEENEIAKLTSNQEIWLHLSKKTWYNLGLRQFRYRGWLIVETSGYGHEEYYVHLEPGKDIILDTTINPDAFIPQMGFIYCDFVRFSYVGQEMVPILKTFPFNAQQDNTRSQYITHQFNSLEFYEISKYDLSDMKFWIKDITGKNMPFKHPKANLIITLLLRRKKNIMELCGM